MPQDQVRPGAPPVYLSPEARAVRAIAEGRSGEEALRKAIAREVREAVGAAVKDAEEIEKLRQSEKHYRVFAEQSSDVFWIMGLDMKFTYVSPSVERMRGFTPEEVLQQRMDEIFTPASLALIGGSLQNGLRDEAAGLIEPHLWRIMELEQICKDGRTLWTEAAATWLKNEQGQVIGVLGVTRNIDARKRAEEALRRAHEELEQRVVERTAELRRALDELQVKNVALEQLSGALRESENKYRTLVENADAIIMVFDREGRIRFVNRVGAQRIGRAPEELVGRSPAELLPADDAEPQLRELRRVFETGESHTLEWHGHGAGEGFWFRISLSPLQDAGGATHAVMVIATDITDLKKSEEKLRQADKMVALGSLVSGVAHEINNPNHVISLNVSTFQSLLPELLARLDRSAQQAGDFQVGRLPWPQVREELPRLLEDVRVASNRIKRIVTDLKEYARPDSVEAPAAFELNAAVEDAINLMRPVLRKATGRFELNLDPSLPALFGRKRRIEQVVINLLQNACQALPATDRAIRVRTFQDAFEAVVEVQDEGSGIAPEHLSRLTDPFFTTKRDKGGTGLGLAVSLGIARDHGGALNFRSMPGQGTTARLVLPLPQSSRQERP